MFIYHSKSSKKDFQWNFNEKIREYRWSLSVKDHESTHDIIKDKLQKLQIKITDYNNLKIVSNIFIFNTSTGNSSSDWVLCRLN
jgi:hypothetical protein